MLLQQQVAQAATRKEVLAHQQVLIIEVVVLQFNPRMLSSLITLQVLLLQALPQQV